IQQTADQFFGGHLLNIFALIPIHFVFHYKFWQLFTYCFLHADVMHLVLNLMMLVFIGSDLEALWGAPRFLKFYFFCSSCAGIIYLFLQLIIWQETGLFTPMVGASGAIYGLLVAYGIIYGERVFLFMLLFPMKAKHFVWILVAVEFLTTLYSGRGGLASAAHLAGMAAGFVYLWISARYKIYLRQKAMAPIKDSKLRLVVDNDKKRKPSFWSSSGNDSDPKTWH
ncbi:MAG: rhomboid family intramembrane serine protease, partial [Deltaproteobacteria bacterium]|nr:rhomboid family intramembrane serine protease [Deltaproteobacteria bacterium]